MNTWDLDYSDGRVGERFVDTLLTGGLTVEVKTDRRWHETGNLYIETECYYNTSGTWDPSGLDVTKAAYWAFVINGAIAIFPTEVVKKAVALHGRKISCTTSVNPSKGYLITVVDLLEIQRTFGGVDGHGV